MLKPINLLLVEDDLAVREALARLLKAENYTVFVASNSEEALFHAKTNAIEIVLMDLQLGQEDGWAVFHALKELDPNLPVIVASAHRNRLQHSAVSRSSGALEKPFDLTVLLGLLAQAASPRTLRRRSSLAACAATLFALFGLLFGFRASALQITNLRFENGNAVLAWQGGGTTNQVQFQNGLGGEWQDIDIPTSASTLTNIVIEPSGFYRVVIMPDVSASADKKAPSTPTGLTARASSCSQIDLSWTASSDSGPNATGVQGYNLYRNGIFLKQVLAPATSASDTGLAGLTTYSYTVLAVDNSRNSSSKSSPASATTPSCGGGTFNQPPVANAGADLSVTVGSYASFNGASSFDPDGAISSYQWDFGDGTGSTGLSVSHYYSFLGVYTVRLTVTDNQGATASATALVTVVSLADLIAPSVSLSSPLNGSTVNGTVALSASASDNSGGSGVARVEYYLDGAATPFASSTFAPYSASYDTSGLGNGTHTFTARAYDNAGNSATSSGASVSVNNTTTSGGVLQYVKAMLCQNGNATVTGIGADHAGNVIAVGYFAGTVDFGTGPISSTLANSVTDAFIAKYNAQGSLVWLKRLGSTGNDSATAVTIDSQNNIIAIGNFQGTVDFGGGLLTAVSSSEMFAVKYSTSGGYLWAKHYTGLTANTGNALAVDGSDNVIIGANCGYNGNFGGVVMNPAGGGADIDVALGKVSGSTGATIWAKRFGGVNWDYVRGIAVDRSGDVAVTGYFTSSTDLGAGTIVGGGSYDIFLAKYSGADGSYRWGKTFGSTGGDFGYGVAVDPNTGNVVMTGLFAGAVNFGGGVISSVGGIYLAAYDPSGNYLWAKTTGGSGDSGAAVTIDASGNMAVTGRASNAIYFGGSQSFIGNGQANCFVASFTISGNSAPAYRWTQFYGNGTDGASAGNAVGIDPSGSVIAGGLFMGTIDFGGTSATAAMAGYSSAFLTKYSR